MEQRASISAVIITKNEAYNLPRCLESLAWVDEIVVLDSGSTDNTESIANQYGARFYQNTQWPGFGKQKQMAQQYASSEWVLAIDADEAVSEELKDSIVKVLTDKPSNEVFYTRRLNWVFGRFLKHSGWRDKVIRVYPKNLTGYNDSLVHEKVIIPKGVLCRDLSGDLLHYSYRNLNHYLVKSAGYAKTWADAREQQGKKATLLQGVTHAISCFLKMYLLRRGFLDGKQGLLIALLSSHSTFVKYADLWIRSQETDNLGKK